MPQENKRFGLDDIVAQDIMDEVIVKVKKDTPVSQVAHLMLRTKMSGVVIVDENEKIAGIITLTDLFVLMDRIAKGATKADQESRSKRVSLQEILERGKARPVWEFMTRNVVLLSPQTTMREIIDMVVKWHVHTFPVVKEGVLVGVIDRHDILNAFFVYG